MNKNFPGKTAVHVSSPYSKEHSCKKSKKSLERFSGKIGNQPTNQPTNQPQYQAWPQLTLRTVASLEGDHLNVRDELARAQEKLRTTQVTKKTREHK